MVKSIRRSEKELDARATLARMQHALEQDFEADEDNGSHTAVWRFRRSGAQGSGVAAVRAGTERKKRRVLNKSGKLTHSQSGFITNDNSAPSKEQRNVQSLGGTKFQPSDSMQEVTFIAAWGHVAHLQQEKGMSKRQEVAKSLTTGIRENAVASPIPWRSNSPVIDVACGEAGTIFIDANGGAVAFTARSERRARRLVSTCVSHAAVGRQAALLIISSNAVQIDAPAWNTQRPINLPGFKAVAVACGAYHCLVATSCGELFAWGEGNAGQLGLGDEVSNLKTFRNQPCQVRLADEIHGVLAKVSSERGAISCGTYHSAVATTDGALWTWGWSEHGRLGRASGTFFASVQRERRPSTSLAYGLDEDEDGRPSGVPRRVIFEEVSVLIRAVACGSCHTLALTLSGHVYGCGWNEYGQACGRTTQQQTAILSMTRVNFCKRSRRSSSESSLSSFAAISVAAGFAHSLALDAKGAACAWGFGEDGQLGGGSECSSYHPIEVVVTTSRNKKNQGHQRPFALAKIAAAGTYSVGVATKCDLISLEETIDERCRLISTRIKAATCIQALARRAACIRRRKLDRSAVTRLRAATKAAVTSETSEPLILELADFSRRKILWSQSEGLVAQQNATMVVQRIVARRALAASANAAIDLALKESSLSRQISDLNAVIAFVSAVSAQEVDAGAVLKTSRVVVGCRWQDAFEPLNRAMKARNRAQESRRYQAVLTISRIERGRQARARRLVRALAAHRLASFAVAIVFAQKARVKHRAAMLKKAERCRLENKCAKQVTNLIRQFADSERLRRQSESAARERALKVRRREVVALIIQRAVRRHAAIRIRRCLEQEARRVRERAYAEHEQRCAAQAAKLKRLREDRERRASLDARLAREATRECFKYLRDLQEKDAEAAASAASAAAQAFLRAKRERARDRRAKAANDRRRQQASSCDIEANTQDEAKPLPHMEQGCADEECPEIEEAQDARPPTFVEYAEALKSVPRTSSFEEHVPDDLDRSTTSVPQAQQRRVKPRFKTVAQWVNQATDAAAAAAAAPVQT